MTESDGEKIARLEAELKSCQALRDMNYEDRKYPTRQDMRNEIAKLRGMVEEMRAATDRLKAYALKYAGVFDPTRQTPTTDAEMMAKKFLHRITREFSSTGSAQAEKEKATLEAIAAECHNQWSGWMKYLFTRTTPMVDPTDFAQVIPAEWVGRWTRQMETAYADLSERDKGSDRIEARKIIAAMEAQNK